MFVVCCGVVVVFWKSWVVCFSATTNYTLKGVYCAVIGVTLLHLEANTALLIMVAIFYLLHY